jgi:hypothetical protein
MRHDDKESKVRLAKASITAAPKKTMRPQRNPAWMKSVDAASSSGWSDSRGVRAS